MFLFSFLGSISAALSRPAEIEPVPDQRLVIKPISSVLKRKLVSFRRQLKLESRSVWSPVGVLVPVFRRASPISSYGIPPHPLPTHSPPLPLPIDLCGLHLTGFLLFILKTQNCSADCLLLPLTNASQVEVHSR